MCELLALHQCAADSPPAQDAHNLLRPESVESFYILWKATGDPRYKQWAWQVRWGRAC